MSRSKCLCSSMLGWWMKIGLDVSSVVGLEGLTPVLALRDIRKNILTNRNSTLIYLPADLHPGPPSILKSSAGTVTSPDMDDQFVCSLFNLSS